MCVTGRVTAIGFFIPKIFSDIVLQFVDLLYICSTKFGNLHH